jgi:hypothetical protein
MQCLQLLVTWHQCPLQECVLVYDSMHHVHVHVQGCFFCVCVHAAYKHVHVLYASSGVLWFIAIHHCVCYITVNSYIRAGCIIEENAGFAVCDIQKLCGPHILPQLSIRAWSRIVGVVGGRSTTPSLKSMQMLHHFLVQGDRPVKYASSGCLVSPLTSMRDLASPRAHMLSANVSLSAATLANHWNVSALVAGRSVACQQAPKAENGTVNDLNFLLLGCMIVTRSWMDFFFPFSFFSSTSMAFDLLLPDRIRPGFCSLSHARTRFVCPSVYLISGAKPCSSVCARLPRITIGSHSV